MLDLVEMEVRELLNKYQFKGDTAKVVQIASLPALNGEAKWEDSITNLIAALDTEIPEPQRDVDKPFLMAIEDVFSIKGRGTVVTGRYRARHREDVGRGRDHRLPPTRARRSSRAWRCSQAARPGASGRQRRHPAARHREERRGARSDPGEAGLCSSAQEVRRRGVRPEEGRGRPPHAVLHELPPAVLHAGRRT